LARTSTPVISKQSIQSWLLEQTDERVWTPTIRNRHQAAFSLIYRPTSAMFVQRFQFTEAILTFNVHFDLHTTPLQNRLCLEGFCSVRPSVCDSFAIRFCKLKMPSSRIPAAGKNVVMTGA
jgi:hypothetical protein